MYDREVRKMLQELDPNRALELAAKAKLKYFIKSKLAKAEALIKRLKRLRKMR